MPLTISSMALMLFLIANPIGNIPVFVSLIKEYDFRHQRWILFREAIFSLLLAFFFLFVGEPFLKTVLVELYSVYLSGGILVFLISLTMLFPIHTDEKGPKALTREPFVVPIATPLISGGGVFSTILILSKQAPLANVSLAILIAWAPVFVIVIGSVYLQKILGKRGLIAIEQLMGMVLLMLSITLITKGLHAFGTQAHISFLNLLTA